MGILKSPGMMEKVISKLALNVNFFIEGSVRDVEVYGDDVPIEVFVDETTSGMVHEDPLIQPYGGNCYKLRTEYDDADFRAEYAYGDVVSEPFGTFTVTKGFVSTYRDNSKPLYFMIRNIDVVIEAVLKESNRRIGQ